MYISKSIIKKMLKDAGAERVSDSSAKAFQDMLNKFAFGVAQKSVKLCKHAKRKTVEESDIKLAFQ
ncbi:MAG: NFYB/HAP3 family transcription factor subunit [Candidatus Marsarchaeota archaeon]|nr:NFYB/HAP3 family transcription factor subunit [Candidatus Marsarchaeota archaeon]